MVIERDGPCWGVGQVTIQIMTLMHRPASLPDLAPVTSEYDRGIFESNNE